MPRLTDSVVRKAKPRETRYALTDSDVTGLEMQITPASTRTWYYRGRVNGKRQRVRLGRFPAVSLTDARKAARTLAGDAATGDDLPTGLAKRIGRLTLGDLFEYYMTTHAKLHKRTWKRDEAEFERWFDDWRERSGASITKADVRKRIAEIATDSGKAPANKARALLSVVFNKAIDADLCDRNPVKGTQRYELQPRQRYLKQSEVQAFLRAVNGLARATTRDYFLMLIATGQRRGSVGAMRWQDIDLDSRTWTIPAAYTKAKRAQVVPLTDLATDIIKARMLERDADCEWVFRGGGASGHIVEPKAALQTVREKSGLSDVTLHDIRRTLGTWATAGGLSLRTVQLALGHTDSRTTAKHYAALENASVREGMNQTVERILEAAGEDRPKLGVVG
jgi:integrase